MIEKALRQEQFPDEIAEEQISDHDQGGVMDGKGDTDDESILLYVSGDEEEKVENAQMGEEEEDGPTLAPENEVPARVEGSYSYVPTRSGNVQHQQRRLSS